MSTLADALVATLRATARAYAAGDQVAPCALLWPDPDRLWEPVIPALQKAAPELFLLGDYAPDRRSGPAVWLRCIEARLVDGAPRADTPPLFYLPGVTRERLRAAEDCPQELVPLVELQHRGVSWLHVNGKEWTPNAYLVSNRGGLELDVARDQATLTALNGALPALLDVPLSQLRGRRLDADFFNELLAPDTSGLVLRWLSEPDSFKEGQGEAAWSAFCRQCRTDFSFDPTSEGPFKAAQLLAGRAGRWHKVWQRFAEAPGSYPGVIDWLKRATPKQPNLFDTAEVWPDLNAKEEQHLLAALTSLVDLPQDKAIAGVLDLETKHSPRRGYPWPKLGMSPLAMALEPLASLARWCQTPHGAPSAEAYAEFYLSEGWQVDAAAVATMAACGTPEQHGPVLGTLRAIYLPWLEGTARHLQQLMRTSGDALSKRGAALAAEPGRVVLFADGLRMDVAQQLGASLRSAGHAQRVDWEWSTIPSVTATAKPAAAPVADAFQGGASDDQFSTRLAASGQLVTQDRFTAALEARGWALLAGHDTGDPSGYAWTEAGTLDKRGHTEGWKMARSVESEVRDLAARVGALLNAGWKEVVVVTDHGWLLMPGGLPKVELNMALADHRWGRCAALRPGSHADPPVFKWRWNHDVSIASPPGVGCFRASVEYSHGGVSLQEMVTPVLHVRRTAAPRGSAHLLDAKWVGAKCRISVGGPTEGARVDVRTSQSDGETSLLTGKQAQEITADGKVTVFLEDDADIGKAAEIVLLNPSGQVIDSLSTTLGE